MSEWRPIETAPKDTPVDLWVARHPSRSGTRATDMKWNRLRGRWQDWMGLPLNDGWEPTHWMPTPEPPSEPNN